MNSERKHEMLEDNTRQVNKIMARIFLFCSLAMVFLVVCSWAGVFEFGINYTVIILIAGLIITVSPSILIHFMSDSFMKHYMLIAAAVFIGILGTNNHIGIYITYIVAPVLSCLYFEPKLVVKTSIFSYIILMITEYIKSAKRYEVIYQGMSRMQIYIAYILGYAIEFLIISAIMYFLVKRARAMMVGRNQAEEENRMRKEFLSHMSHELRTPMNAILGMTDVAMNKEMTNEVRKCFAMIRTSAMGMLNLVNHSLDISGTDEKEESLDHQQLMLNVKDVKLLLVDDNDMNREVVKAMLEPYDIHIDEAVNGKEAVKMVQDKPYDIIFMDSHMPLMNGEEATRSIRQMNGCQNQNIPIIALTADAIDGVKERLLSSGMNDYIVKPISIRVICNVIREYLPKHMIK